MNQQFRGRDPRVEVSDELPCIPDDLWPSGPEAPLLNGHGGTLEEFADLCMTQLEGVASDGSASAGAAIALTEKLVPDYPDRSRKLFRGLTAEQSTVAGLYALAAVAFADGCFDDACLLLALLAAASEAGPWGYLGLAVLATRNELDDLAATLIADTLDKPDRHPRASSVAAICALGRGKKADAQTHLAAAARLARRRAEFRTELQLAQRALLLMHLKHS